MNSNDHPKKNTCGAVKMVKTLQDQAIHTVLSRIQHKLLVMSGKGGVGKTTMAVNLAVAMARKGYAVGLMDVDMHGPDIPRMLGLKESARINPDRTIDPVVYSDKLKVLSVESILREKDAAVIWRGPLRAATIRQFITDVNWGEIDFLIIDAPPGTGDEPLTVAKAIEDVWGVIVTTPQEISLADVRKSIRFCRQIDMRILGIIENMSGLICPHCHGTIDLFKIGGGRRVAQESDIPFLGAIPLDPNLTQAADLGSPYLNDAAATLASKAFAEIVANISNRLGLNNQ
ncbi:MAG: Mrp/NBP35 family ATP-binding protein [Deltaproteobacteria bacterium]|nr:Mrp/NBP35 family ATP-binding protein [Deltaproteobacteria bacterium]